MQWRVLGMSLISASHWAALGRCTRSRSGWPWGRRACCSPQGRPGSDSCCPTRQVGNPVPNATLVPLAAQADSTKRSAAAMLQQPRVPATGQRQAIEIQIKWREVLAQKQALLKILSRHTGHSIQKLDMVRSHALVACEVWVVNLQSLLCSGRRTGSGLCTCSPRTPSSTA